MRELSRDDGRRDAGLLIARTVIDARHSAPRCETARKGYH